jgi:hypothetical protein
MSDELRVGSESAPGPDPRPTDEDEPTDDTVDVVVAHDTPPGRVMAQPVHRRIPREAQRDWDERYWRRIGASVTR